jgi:hypothetical protein
MKQLKKISLVSLSFILIISFVGCSLLRKATNTALQSTSYYVNLSSKNSLISSDISSFSLSSSAILSSSIATSTKTSSVVKIDSSKQDAASSPQASSVKTTDTTQVINKPPVVPVVSIDTSTPSQPSNTSSSVIQASSTNSSQSGSNTTVQLPNIFQDFWGETGMQGIQVYEYGKGLLNSEERIVYDQLRINIINVNNGFTITSTCAPDSVIKVFEYLYNDHSEIFYMHGGTNYSWSSKSGTYSYTFTLFYDYDKQKIIDMRTEMGTAAVSLLNTAKATLSVNASDYDKEKAIHDAVVMHCSYDMVAVQNPNNNLISFTAYGAFVKGKCVCDGYARAMKMLLSSVGIKSLYVSGIGSTNTSSGAHAWNLVYVPDKNGTYSWWYVDATFDDPLVDNGNGTYSDLGKPSYSFWNFLDRSDHVLGEYLSSSWSNSQNYQFMPKAGSLNNYYDNSGTN